MKPPQSDEVRGGLIGSFSLRSIAIIGVFDWATDHGKFRHLMLQIPLAAMDLDPGTSAAVDCGDLEGYHSLVDARNHIVSSP